MDEIVITAGGGGSSQTDVEYQGKVIIQHIENVLSFDNKGIHVTT